MCGYSCDITIFTYRGTGWLILQKDTQKTQISNLESYDNCRLLASKCRSHERDCVSKQGGILLREKQWRCGESVIIKEVRLLCLNSPRVAPRLQREGEGNSDYFNKTCIICSHLGGRGVHLAHLMTGEGHRRGQSVLAFNLTSYQQITTNNSHMHWIGNTMFTAQLLFGGSWGLCVCE